MRAFADPGNVAPALREKHDQPEKGKCLGEYRVRPGFPTMPVGTVLFSIGFADREQHDRSVAEMN